MSVEERLLEVSPSLGPLFARAGLAMVPGASRLPLIGGGPRGDEVPDTVLGLSQVTVDRDRLAAYDRVCGSHLSDTLPVSFPHLLSFPLGLALMTDPRFPVRAIGLVHVANTIRQLRSIGAAESLSLRVWATSLRPHPRGRVLELRTEVHIGAELVWEETSTYLARGHRDGRVRAPPGPPATAGLPENARWRLPGDLGRRYGRVSGDLNPIHVHPLSAKLFGFPTAIAHGMWTVARCLAQLGAGGGRTPDALAVEVTFRRPILLPATVAFAEALAAESPTGAVAFGVRDARCGTPHLDGRLAPLAD